MTSPSEEALFNFRLHDRERILSITRVRDFYIVVTEGSIFKIQEARRADVRFESYLVGKI